LVTVIVLIDGKHQSSVSSVPEILILNGFFVALFLGFARLFRNAAREQTPAGNKPPSTGHHPPIPPPLTLNH